MSNRSAKTPSAPSAKARRQEAIVDLLSRESIASQAELSSQLESLQIQVNQGTLSRDLRELGVVKTPAGYRLPSASEAGGQGPAALAGSLARWLTSAVAAQNQVVLRTPPSGAQPLALALDQADLEQVLGTVAGDDTIVVVTPSAKAAKELAGQLERLAGGVQ